MKEEGSLAAFSGAMSRPGRLRRRMRCRPSAESVALSKELKELGWKFVGPTTVYVFME